MAFRLFVINACVFINISGLLIFQNGSTLISDNIPASFVKLTFNAFCFPGVLSMRNEELTPEHRGYGESLREFLR